MLSCPADVQVKLEQIELDMLHEHLLDALMSSVNKSRCVVAVMGFAVMGFVVMGFAVMGSEMVKEMHGNAHCPTFLQQHPHLSH